MADALVAREITVLDVFSGRGALVIPPYQREYSWTEADALRLLDDLWLWSFDDGAVKTRRKKSQPPARPYFLGTILVVEPEPDEDALVVDGHQRLMTLTMLIAVLRDLETAKDKKTFLHDLVRKKGRSLIRQAAGWRLSALERDRAVFLRTVQTDGATRKAEGLLDDDHLPEAQRRILRNTAALRLALKSEPAKRRRDFISRVLTDTFVVRLTVRDEDAAFAMFEVINQRGQPLSPKHVLKARLLAGFERGSERERAAAAAWSAMEGDFPTLRREDRDLVDLFERFLDTVARAYEGARRPKPGESLVGRLETVAATIGPDAFIETHLPQAAEAYAAFAPHPARQPTGDPLVDQYCEYLSWWEEEEWAGVAVRALAAHADPTVRAQILARLERFAAVMGLASERKNSRLRDYRRALAAVEDVDALMSVDGPLEPRPELIRAARERICDMLPSEKSVRRAILARVNAALDPGRSPPLPSREGTIEHILPRTVARRADDAANGDYPEWSRKDARAAVETLGNLALIDDDDNARADRRPYAQKLSVYFAPDRASKYAILEDLRLNGVAEWTPDTWRTRQDRLTGLLIAAWDLGSDGA